MPEDELALGSPLGSHPRKGRRLPARPPEPRKWLSWAQGQLDAGQHIRGRGRPCATALRRVTASLAAWPGKGGVYAGRPQSPGSASLARHAQTTSPQAPPAHARCLNALRARLAQQRQRDRI